MTTQNIHDLESARFFTIAARHGNVRSAAEELGVSQSTVSRRIQSLEDTVGAKLLIRRPEGVTPTDVGRRILAASSELEEVSRRLSLITSGLKNGARVTFTATDGIGGYWLPIILANFPEDNPGITLQVKCRDMGRGVDLAQGETDVDVAYIPPTDPDSVVLGRATMQGRMFGSERYFEKHDMPKTLADLADHPACILEGMLNPGLGTGDWARYAALLSNHNNITYSVNSALALGFAIRSGWGLGSQPSLVEKTEPNMVMLPEEVYSVTMQFWLVVHKDVKDNPAPRLLVQWIKDRMIRSFMDGRATFEVMI